MSKPHLNRANLFGAIIFLVIGLIIGGWFLLRPEKVSQAPRVKSGELVTVVEAASTFAAPRVHAQGTVIPAREVTIQPEVSGRILKRHEGLVDGGVVQKGETLLQIDPRDYKIALEEARTGVDVAKAELAMEEGRQVVARQEWQRFGAEGEEPPPLALREPQLMQAELAIDSAQQRLRRAQLDSERTRLKAPFTALVTKADLEVGELVGPSTSGAKLVALDEFWVKVSIPLESLDLLAIPGRGTDQGSPALVRHESGSRHIEQRGHIIRLLGDLDPAGRMAQVLVSVQDPFWAPEERDSELNPKTPLLRSHPLMLGSYVSVEFEGNDPRTVILLPRVAVREGKYLYIATEDDKLEIREVDFAWKSRDTVAVEQDLKPGERVIISGLAAPVQGMPLRVELAEDLPELESPPFDDDERDEPEGTRDTQEAQEQEEDEDDESGEGEEPEEEREDSEDTEEPEEESGDEEEVEGEEPAEAQEEPEDGEDEDRAEPDDEGEREDLDEQPDEPVEPEEAQEDSDSADSAEDEAQRSSPEASQDDAPDAAEDAQ